MKSALKCALALFTLLPTALLASDTAADGESLEYQLKAAFLLNFTRFADWPANAFVVSDSPIAICVIGDDPFGSVIDQIVAGEVVGGRKVVVRRLNGPPAPKACHVLYMGKPEKALLKNLPASGSGILTVGEGDAFLREGGIIAFILDNRRVRFDINQSAAETAGLKLSARLLSVARAVEK